MNLHSLLVTESSWSYQNHQKTLPAFQTLTGRRGTRIRVGDSEGRKKFALFLTWSCCLLHGSITLQTALIIVFVTRLFSFVCNFLLLLSFVVYKIWFCQNKKRICFVFCFCSFIITQLVLSIIPLKTF